MDNQVSELLRAMVRTTRSGRAHPTALALRTIKDEFTKNGGLGHGRFPVALDQSVAAEYEVRVNSYIGMAKRVFAESGIPWTRSAANDVQHLITTELITDWEGLLDQLRSAVGPSGKIRIDALEAAQNRLRSHIEQELSLLAIREDRTKVPLADALSSPRYGEVLGAWRKADLFFRQVPPDFANAAKEAVGAVEALARILTGDRKATLGDCIKTLRASGRIAAPLLKGLEELWGAASDRPGVRHGGTATDLEPATARYIFDLAEAALRLLLQADAA